MKYALMLGGWIYCLVISFVISFILYSLPFLLPIEYHDYISGIPSALCFIIPLALSYYLYTLPLTWIDEKLNSGVFMKVCSSVFGLITLYNIRRLWIDFFAHYGKGVYGNILSIDTPIVMWELSILFIPGVIIYATLANSEERRKKKKERKEQQITTNA